MATVAELLVRIGGDSSGLRREINNSQRQLRRAFGPEALELSEGAAGLLGALAVAMGAVGVAAVKMSSDYAVAKTAFTTLLGSAEEADTMLRDLATFAADTPFELPGLIQSAKKLMAFQFAAEDIIPIMSAVGDAVSLVGGGQEAIDGIVRALGQISAKGKLSAEEMNQLSELGINGWKYIANEMGISTAEVMKLSEQGAVDATTAINAVVKGMQTNFTGGMDAMAKTVPGLLSTIKDNAGMVLKDIGEKITVALDLTGVLANVSNFLTQFSTVVKSAGIKDAILGLIPPETTAAVFALGGALIAVAIPAMYSFATATWLALAPMIPYIAAGAAIGLLAYEIWRNWEPLSDLFITLWKVITSVTSEAWSAITSTIDDNIGWAIAAIGDAWNSIGELTDSIWSSITDVIDSAWQGIKDIVASGVGWIVSKMQPLINLVGAAIPSGLTDFFYSVSNGLDKVKKTASAISLGFTAKDISSLIPSQQSKPNTTFTGLHGNASNFTVNGGLSDKEAKKAEKEWEQLEKKAEQVSKSIRDEWIQLTGTQMDALENWKNDELKTLNESAAANENYERDLGRLYEIYAAKKKKILYDQQKDTNSIWDKALSDAETLQEKLGSIGLFGVDKSKFDIETDAAKQITAIQTKYRDLSLEYENGTAEQKLQMSEAWKSSGKEFEIMADGTVSFSKQAANERYIVEKELAEKIKNLHYDTQKFKDNLDRASENGNLPAYIAELNSERAALSQDLAGKQEMMSAYYANWKETHRTSMSYMAEGMTSFQSGLAGIFEDIGTNVKSAEDLMKSFGSMVMNILIKMQAQAAAASITSSLFGNLFGSSTTSKAPTVTTSDMINGKTKWFASGGAVFGAGTGTSDSIMAMLSNGEYVINAASVSKFGTGFFDSLNAGQLPAFATGGIVTGASLSSIGNYSNTNTSTSKAASEPPNMRVNINNYGNANVQAENPQYDAQSKSWVLNVVIDGLKNNSSMRSAVKGAVK